MAETPVVEIERIEIVTPIQGRQGCVFANRVVTFAGETRPMAPINLLVGDIDASGLPKAVQDALSSINTQLRSERDTALAAKATAESALATMTAERDSLQSQVAQLEADKAALQAELDALKNPPQPEMPTATLSQIRVWLLQNLGATAIQQVDAMIDAIPDELQRMIARQQWEYANNVLRDNPFFLVIAQHLGMTTEQMDAVYLEACQIV
jgi:hypothetical protein